MRIVEYKDSHAGKLAEMWDGSDEGWRGERKRMIHYLVLSTTPNEAKKHSALSGYVDEDLRDGSRHR